MKARHLILALLLCVASAHADQWAPRELLVKLRVPPRQVSLDEVSNVGVGRIDSLVRADRAECMLPFSPFRERIAGVTQYLLLRFHEEIDIAAEASLLESEPSVEWASPNHLFQTDFIPNDSGFPAQWQLARIEAPEAWDISKGDSSVLIGIIDTGIDYLHPDLAPNLWRNTGEIAGNGIDDDGNGFVDDTIGWDFVDAPSLPAGGDDLTRDADPMDEMGHGTFVAGVACAATNNEIGVASIGFRCRLMALRAGNRRGWLEEDDVAAALLYAMDNGARVVNMSFGDVAASPLLRETVRLVHDAGVVLVASAGNSNSSIIHYPSGYGEVIAVGACTQNDQRASFSNYGPWVDVFAPGIGFLSTELGGTVGTWGGLNNGTSYTAPLVAGLAGLILSANTLITPEQMLNLLRETADDLYPPGWDSLTAHGRINARRALENAAFTSGVVAQIIFPETDDGFHAPFDVIGTAAGPALRSWRLLSGIGENPPVWQTISQGNYRVVQGFLGTLTVPQEDTVIALRLEAEATDGTKSIDHVHLYVDHTPPVVLEMTSQTMLDADHFGVLLRLKTDDICSAALLLRKMRGDSVREDFGYVSNSHAVFLSQLDYPNIWNYRVLCKNRAGLETWTDETTLRVDEPPFASNTWPSEMTNLPNGYLLPKATDFDGDGRPEILMNQFRNGYFDTLRIFEWTGSGFVDVHYSYGLMIPQDIGDHDGDGLLEFLGRAYDRTYLFEQQAAGHFPDTLLWLDSSGFRACALLDVDPEDEQTELLAWREFNGKARYGLFRMEPGPNPVLMDTLPNPTEGGNSLGPPYALVGDFDEDSLTDFLYGDYDGDVIFCELQLNGRVTAPWHFRLPYGDATTWLAAADADGDGQTEFIAGCYYMGEGATESQIRARHWEYLIFHLVGNDSFAPVDTIMVLGVEDPGDYEATVAAGDIDGDGRAEFLLSAFPDLYVIKYNPATLDYAPAAYFAPSECNAILLSDWNNNGLSEFFFSDGQGWRRAETETAAGVRPMPPVGLEGEPLGPHDVLLTWREVAGADSYRVWKGQTADELTLLMQVTPISALISDLPENVEYFYAVTTVDHDFLQLESAFSSFVRVTANQAPAVEHEASFIAPHFVRVQFSEAMGPSILWQRCYRLDDGRMPGVITTAQGEQVAFLKFDEGFEPRRYRMTLLELRDAQNSLLPRDSGWVEFTVSEESPIGPYVATVRILSPTSLELSYSEPMNESVLDVANYQMTPVGDVISVEPLSAERSMLRLLLDERWPIGAVGRSVALHVTNVFNEDGVPLDSVNGVVLIEAVAPNLDDVYVYPNPYKGVGANGTNCVMFAGLTRNSKIYIFSLQGRKLRTLEGVNSAGGLSWCLDTDAGEQVASGIYLYTVTDASQTRRGKLAVFR
ncbi:MAG: S8 family serine peptidase [bacterium]